MSTPDYAPVAARPAPGLWQGKYALLLRREFWEHRALWLAPVVVALLMVVAPLFGNFRAPGGGVFQTSAPDLPPQLWQQFGAVLLFGQASVLGIIACIVSVVYLLDCLFAERKDRSILFWKSLPVSDAQTVCTKLAVALLAVPLLTLLLSLLSYVLLAGLLYLRYEHLRPAMEFAFNGHTLALVPRLVGQWAFALLWYAPAATYLMLASVLAKRAPLVYAALPPAVLILLEGLAFDTRHVASFLGQWLVRPWRRASQPGGSGENLVQIMTPDWSPLLREPDIWLGLAAAALMVYIIIRLRRYRDDT